MFTETYIKMASLAEPIQKMRPVGSYWEAGDHHGYRLECLFISHGNVRREEKEDIWYPLQHQLQSIYGFPWFEYDEKCREIIIGSICRLKRAGFADDAFSKEEAGIMLIMKKFNRQWTGEGWEEIK